MTIMTFSSSDGTRRCNARCHRATQPECECICGGAYHGCAVRGGGGALPKDIIDAELMAAGLSKDALTDEQKHELTMKFIESAAATMSKPVTVVNAELLNKAASRAKQAKQAKSKGMMPLPLF